MILHRRTLLTALPFCGLAPAFAAAGPPLAMVMNSGEASVSIIDMSSRKVVRTVSTLREPSHWALSLDRTKLFIADASGNALFILDPRTGAALGHRVIADPYQLGYTPDQKYLVVNALRLNHVDVYDAGTLALVKRFSPGGMPSHLDFSPDGKWTFCSCQESGTLFSFDNATLTPRWTVQVGPTPAGVLWLDGKVLVCIMGSDHFVEVDPVTGALGRRVVTGEGAHNLFLNDDGTTLYVSNRIGGSLCALDPATLKVSRTYALPGGPDDIGIAPDGKLWIAMRFAETVAVLDPATGQHESIPVGRSPHGIFLTTEMAKSGKLTAEAL